MEIEFFADEEWLELHSDARYLVSTNGRLYDTVKFQLMKLSVSNTGKAVWYTRSRPRPGSRNPSSNRAVDAAVAVLKVFVGLGYVPRFADGDSTNVRLENLSWTYADKIKTKPLQTA